MSLAEKLFGSFSDRELKKIKPITKKVLALETKYQPMSDAELQAQTPALKERLANGETLDDILPDAFAVCREAAWRVLGMKHFPVQIMGGIARHRGSIAEMQTGEGKTLVATLPAYLNALTGEGVHIVTVNDYLAKRDSEWMGKVHRFLGLSVTARYIRSSYGALFTNNALGFDVAAYARIPLNRMLEGAWVSAGAKISDFGFTFDDSNYDLPTKFSVGGSLFAPIRDSHSPEASVDLGYRYSSSEKKSFGMGIGVEYVLMQLIAVRGGYHVAYSHGDDYGTSGA